MASTKAISDLADGFLALECEFKNLAAQHDSITKQLHVMSEQRDTLKRLIPESLRTEQITDALKEPLREDTVTIRPVLDWVGDLRGSAGSEAQTSMAKIRDAEFACFKIREKLRHREAPLKAGGKHSPSIRQDARTSFADMEEDHTITRRPGKLGCPFAKPNDRGSRSQAAAPHPLAHDMPTPHSSGSQIELLRHKSRRTSFDDPIMPPQQPQPAAASETGAACPIRFLGQHTPEDVAKYFEDHKHELPRSHESCVKRFQSNSQSVKEIDAKYGDLVGMIQGLGRKHQPMLPEAAVVCDDSKSSHRVLEWAKTVSEGHQDVRSCQPAETGDDDDDETGEDARLSHFARPLKEVRLGESPSRPWGVPVPASYLDKLEQSAVLEESQALDPSREVIADAAGVLTDDTPMKHQQRKGNCPFRDHFTGPKAVLANSSISEPRRATKTKAYNPRPVANHTELRTPRRMMNFGLALVADQRNIGALGLENHGTLVLGYGVDDLGAVQREYQLSERQKS